jgi:hypothetical protein
MNAPVTIGDDGLVCSENACNRAKTCLYARSCKTLTDAAAEDKAWAERDERQRQLLKVEQKLNDAGLDLDDCSNCSTPGVRGNTDMTGADAVILFIGFAFVVLVVLR